MASLMPGVEWKCGTVPSTVLDTGWEKVPAAEALLNGSHPNQAPKKLMKNTEKWTKELTSVYADVAGCSVSWPIEKIILYAKDSSGVLLAYLKGPSERNA